MPRLSRHVSREALVKLLGDAGAARLLKVFGGVRMLTPGGPESPSFARFAAKLGEEIARKFCAEFGKSEVSLPRRLVPLNEEIMRLHREMLAPAEISRRLHCTERYVYLVLSRQ
jgi:hypothetical protein